METTTEKTTPTVEETTPSISSLMAEEPATATIEETTSEVVSEAETPAASEEPAPVEPAAEEKPAEAEETPSTSEEAELPSGIGHEDIGGTSHTADTMPSTKTKGKIKNKLFVTLAAVVALVATAVATLTATYAIKNNKAIDKINAAGGGNNTSTETPADKQAETIAKGKNTVDSVLAGYPGYAKEGENFIQNNGTSTTVYFKMKNKTNGKKIIVPVIASGVAADTFDDYFKQVGDFGENGAALLSIGNVYVSVETYKEANPVSVETIDSIVANVNKVVGKGTVYVGGSSKQVNSGINMTTRFYVDGLGDKIGFSEYVKEKTAETESKFIEKMDRAMKGGYPSGRFALDKDVSPEIEAKIAEINKPATQPTTPAEGETGTETEDPNASI